MLYWIRIVANVDQLDVFFLLIPRPINGMKQYGNWRSKWPITSIQNSVQLMCTHSLGINYVTSKSAFLEDTFTVFVKFTYESHIIITRGK